MTEIEIGRGKRAQRAWSFDDIAIVPNRRTRDPQDVSTAWKIDAYNFELPVLGAPMDSVVSPETAVQIGKLGGLGVLDLEGLWTRYEDPSQQLNEIAKLSPEQATARMQQIYAEPIKPELIRDRLSEIRAAGVTVAGALSPQRAAEFSDTVIKAGVDLFVIRGTTVSAEHVSKAHEPLNLKKFVREIDIPVIVGGCASYQAALHLMRTGAAGVLVGVGPGHACTTRAVLGLGVPQATAIADARARGVSVVVSAGNNLGGAVQYPANCAGTIAAGAAEQDGQLATYTAKGAGTGFVTLHAPGNSNGLYVGASNTGTSSPNANGSTAFLFAGTSFSAPMVAGAISLLKAVRPSLTPSQIDSLLSNNALAYPANASNSSGLFGRLDCTPTSCGVGLLNVLGAVQAARSLANPLPVANVQQSAVVASNGPFVLDAALSSNSAGGSSNLTFSWQQVFGNPVVLAGTSTSALQVQSGMAGNIAEFALTVTDTATNRSNTSVVRLANSAVNERTFTPSSTGGGSGSSTGGSGTGTSTPAPVAASSGGGGGGGALGLTGLLGMLMLFGVWRQRPGVA